MPSALSIREVVSAHDFDVGQSSAVEKKQAPFGACFGCELRRNGFVEPAVGQRRREPRLEYVAYRCGSCFQLTNAISDVRTVRHDAVERVLQTRQLAVERLAVLVTRALFRLLRRIPAFVEFVDHVGHLPLHRCTIAYG